MPTTSNALESFDIRDYANSSIINSFRLTECVPPIYVTHFNSQASRAQPDFPLAVRPRLATASTLGHRRLKFNRGLIACLSPFET